LLTYQILGCLALYIIAFGMKAFIIDDIADVRAYETCMVISIIDHSKFRLNYI